MASPQPFGEKCLQDGPGKMGGNARAWRGTAGGPHACAMTRPIIALLVGLGGFAAYVALVVALADFVLDLHWVLQLVYFLVAGIAWAPAARRLMFWGAGVPR